MTLRYVHGAQYAIDASGAMIAGSKLYFYLAGTSQATPQDVFSDSARVTPISQPVLADASGRWPDIFMGDEIYDVVWKDADGVAIDTFLNVDAGLSSALGTGTALAVNQGGTGATTAAAARTNLGVPSQSQLTTATNDIATLRTQVDTGLNGDDEFGALAKEDSVTTALLASGFGDVRLQKVRLETLSNTTTNVTTPAYDTSIPQISEGTLVFSQAFTPKSASSKIRIRARVTGDSATNNGSAVMALFVDATAGAVAAEGYTVGTTAQPYAGLLDYEVSSVSTSARTYTIRVGVSAGTITFNGSTGSLGGVRKSYLEIEEWLTV